MLRNAGCCIRGLRKDDIGLAKEKIGGIKAADIERTEYILSGYYGYKGLKDVNVSRRMSRDILYITMHQMRRGIFTDDDRMLLDTAGPYLVPVIDAAFEEMKSSPGCIREHVLPVIYYRYLSGNVPVCDLNEIKRLLFVNEGIEADTEFIEKAMETGIIYFCDRFWFMLDKDIIHAGQ